MDPKYPQLHELLASLERSREICYALASRGDLIFFNPAWDKFAEENNGFSWLSTSSYGKNIWDIVPSELIPFYEEGFRVAHEKGFWEHDFECASPTEARTYRMHVRPLADGSLLIRNARLHSHAIEPSSVDIERFRDQHGIFHVCSHCRKANVLGSDEWIFVPALLASRELKVSHGLCHVCMNYHYGRFMSGIAGSNS